MRAVLLVLWVALLAGSFSTPAAAQGWTPQASGTSATLFEVLMTDANHGTAVGEGGSIVRTTDGGASWQSVASGTATSLYGVDYCCVTNGIAVGNNGLMLRTTDGGASWDSLPRISTGNLRGISFTSNQVGMVVGTNGTILRSTNGGSTWTEIRGVTATLYEVSFVSPTTGTVVGATGTILRTTDGGVSWPQQASNTTAQLLGVSFVDENLGVAVGTSGKILRTSDGGVTWVSRSSGVGTALTAVTMLDATRGYIVGDAGVILRTTNGGLTWTPQTSGTTADLKEVSFSDLYTGTAVGTGGVILRTTTGGEPVGVLSLASPDGGESYPIGTTMNITWSSGGFVTARIELSRNNGGAWETLSTGTPAANHLFSWIVQGPVSSQCRIRISDADNAALTDVSAGLFAITPAAITVNYGVEGGWNLISVPLTVADYQKTSISPTATSQAYSYDSAGGYQIRSVLQNGRGYWLKFGGTETIPITGFPRTTDSVVVQTGWNIIGSITGAVAVSSLTTNPPGIITGTVYAFAPATGYEEATAIEPGRAYWLKVTQPGTIILASPAPPGAAVR